MDALRQLSFPGSGDVLLPLGIEIALLILQVVLFLFVAQRLLNDMERRARAQGLLSLRGH